MTHKNGMMHRCWLHSSKGLVRLCHPVECKVLQLSLTVAFDIKGAAAIPFSKNSQILNLLKTFHLTKLRGRIVSLQCRRIPGTNYQLGTVTTIVALLSNAKNS